MIRWYTLSSSIKKKRVVKIKLSHPLVSHKMFWWKTNRFFFLSGAQGLSLGITDKNETVSLQGSLGLPIYWPAKRPSSELSNLQVRKKGDLTRCPIHCLRKTRLWRQYFKVCNTLGWFRDEVLETLIIVIIIIIIIFNLEKHPFCTNTVHKVTIMTISWTSRELWTESISP